MSQPKLFKYRNYQAEIILLCLRWYLRYSLSYRDLEDLEEMMAERGRRHYTPVAAPRMCPLFTQPTPSLIRA